MVNHGQSGGLYNVRSKRLAQRKSEVCLCPIVLQPHVFHKSFISEPKFEHVSNVAEYGAVFKDPTTTTAQSENLLSYPPVSSHAVDYVPAPA